MHRKTALALAISLSFVSPRLFAENLDDAKAKLAKGDISGAEEILVSLISGKSKEMPLAAYLLGHVYYEEGEYDLAAEAFGRANNLTIAPYAAFYRAESLFWAHDGLAAKRAYREIVDEGESPFLPWARLRIADVDFALGDYVSAAKEYKKFLADYPSYPYAEALYFALAECARRTGNQKDAAEAYLSIWIYYPYTPSAAHSADARKEMEEDGVSFAAPTFKERLTRARILKEQRMHKESIQELEALRKEVAKAGLPGDAALIVSIDVERGQCLIRLGRVDEAVEVLTRVEESSNNGQKHLATAQAMAGDSKAGAETFADYLGIDGKAKGKQIRPYADFLFDYGLYEKARAEYTKVSKDTTVSFRIAWCDYRLGNYDDAVSEIKALGKKSEYSDFSKYWLARISEKRGDTETAKSGYKALVDADATGYYAILSRSRLALLDPKVAKGTKDEPKEGTKTGAKDEPTLASSARASEEGAAAALAGDKEGLSAEDEELIASMSTRPKSSEIEAAFKDLLALDKDLPEVRRAYEFYEMGLYENCRDELEAVYQGVKSSHSSSYAKSLAERRSRSPYYPDNWAKKRKSDSDSPVISDIDVGSSSSKTWGDEETPATTKPKEESKKSGKSAGLSEDFWKSLGIAFAGAGDAHYPMYLLTAPRGKKFYPRAYPEEVIPISRQFGHAPEELWSLMHTESLFHRFVASSVGAIGLMQIMPKTGRKIAQHLDYDDFRPGALFDAKTNLSFGAWYYGQLKEVFQGQLPLAMAAYNGGPYMVGRIVRGKAWTNPSLDEIIEEIPPDQSRLYAKKVLHKVALYQSLYEGSTSLTVDLTLKTEVGDQVDF